MADPIINQILDQWKTDLLGITVANGYNTNIVDVLALSVPLAENHNAPLASIEELKEEKGPGEPQRQVTALVVIRLVVRNDYSDPKADIIKFASDVERKSEESFGRRHATVIDTQIQEQHFLPVQEQDRDAECVQTYRVRYRHKHGNPEVLQ